MWILNGITKVSKMSSVYRAVVPDGRTSKPGTFDEAVTWAKGTLLAAAPSVQNVSILKIVATVERVEQPLCVVMVDQ